MMEPVDLIQELQEIRCFPGPERSHELSEERQISEFIFTYDPFTKKSPMLYTDRVRLDLEHPPRHWQENHVPSPLQR